MVEALFTFVFTFILIYVLYLIFVVHRSKKLEKIKRSTEVTFIKKRYKLKLDSIPNKKIALDVAFTNAFIISFTLSIMTFIKNFVLQILIGFVILMILILIMYSILGKEYKRKEDKNV